MKNFLLMAAILLSGLLTAGCASSDRLQKSPCACEFEKFNVRQTA